MPTNPALHRVVSPRLAACAALLIPAALPVSARGDLAPPPRQAAAREPSQGRLLKSIVHRNQTDKPRRTRPVQDEELDTDRNLSDPIEMRAAELLARSVEYYHDLDADTEAAHPAVPDQLSELADMALAAAVQMSDGGGASLSWHQGAGQIMPAAGAVSSGGAKPPSSKSTRANPLMFSEANEDPETIVSFRMAVLLTMAAILGIYWLQDELRNRSNTVR